MKDPMALPKFLQCHKWTDRAQIAEMHQLLHQWEPLPPASALALLDAKFADAHIRSYAVGRLDALSDAHLAEFLLQLTQAAGERWGGVVGSNRC